MKKIYSLLFIFLSIASFGQNPADVAQTFGSASGFSSQTVVTVLQPDGKMIIGGSFNNFNSDAEYNIIRLNSDGTNDPTFNTGFGFNSSVLSIVLQPDGKIIVGGIFTLFNNILARNIVRLNSDGSLDTSFNSGSGFNTTGSTSRVLSTVLQVDGKIVVGGIFNTYNGSTANFIVRLNSNGTRDNSFSNGIGFNNIVSSIALQSDGKIIIGGDFTTYNGLILKCVIRLNSDGSKDITFTNPAGSDQINAINSIAIQSDGKIIIGGNFTSYLGLPENHIIRLNSNGTKDSTFNVGAGFNGFPQSIIFQLDGKIVVCGDFTTYNSVTSNQIVRLNSNGLKDNTFSTGVGFNTGAYSITLQSNGKIIVNGSFTSYNGRAEQYMVRLEPNGTKDILLNIGTGLNNIVTTVATQSDGKIVVGGHFQLYNGIPEKQIIRFNNNGTKDTTFNTGLGFNSIVESIALQADGKIIIGGSFSSYNGSSANGIIRLNSNGSIDTTFNSGTGFNLSSIASIALQPDGKIIIGGSFNLYNGLTANRIVRLNSDGTKDASFITGLGFDSSVLAITLQSDGKIILGGFFTSYNGISENYIIRLNSDGTKDGTFITGSSFNQRVDSIAFQPDGKIIVGGSFTSYIGSTANRIIRLNSNGTIDNTFTSGSGFDGTVKSIAIQPDGKIVLGGFFTLYGGITENSIIRLNSSGTKDSTFNSGTGFNNNVVYTIKLQPDGKIVVGGWFSTYNNISSGYLVTLQGNYVLSNQEVSNKNQFTLWPNPTKNTLNISGLNESINSISIYDMKGELIYLNTDYHNTIDVSNLSSGIYFAKIVTENGAFSKKFIKE